MSIKSQITDRNITEILHFTTNGGVLGVLRTGTVIPSSELSDEDQIEYILKHNCKVRKDPRWTGHNSLSITTINARFFEFSRAQHMNDIHVWWCILSFEAIILTHPNVVFCTGNNTWRNSVRATGLVGFEALFAASVPGTYESTIRRDTHTPANVPTCNQAEVLYPGRLSVEYLQKIFVEHQDHADQMRGWISLIASHLPEHIVEIDPDKFKGY